MLSNHQRFAICQVSELNLIYSIPNPSSKYVQLVLNPHQPHCTTLVLQLFYLGWIEIGSGISSKIHLGIISFTSEALWFKREREREKKKGNIHTIYTFDESLYLYTSWICPEEFRQNMEMVEAEEANRVIPIQLHGDDNEKKKKKDLRSMLVKIQAVQEVQKTY